MDSGETWKKSPETAEYREKCPKRRADDAAGLADGTAGLADDAAGLADDAASLADDAVL